MEDRIRVLVAEDEETVLDVLSVLLAADPAIDLVATARDAERAIALASSERPDVALLDVRMPGGGGPRAAREITRRSPETRIVAVSAHEDIDSVLGMLRAGALGYIVKDDPTGEILAAVHRCVEDRTSLSTRVTTDVAHELARVLDRRGEGSAGYRRREGRIRALLERGGIRIVYQPIVDLERESVAGVEALARFDAPPRRPPDAWFAEAEGVGLLRELELEALRLALADLPQIPVGVYLSVNLSPVTAVSEELLETIGSMPPGRLVVELTEHAPVEDYDALNDALAGLRRHGVRVAVDDAGAGFASLRHIVRVAPELIKLDMTLVRGLDADPTRGALVSALAGFAARLGTGVVAEGVETEEELLVLRDLGIRHAQGYLLGRPGPLPAGPAFTPEVALKGRGPEGR